MLASFRATLVFAVFLTALDGRAAPPLPAETLRQRITIQWQDVPLREACHRLAETQRLTIWLDRRLDPNRTISLQANDVPLQQVLDRIAEACGARQVQLPTLCYLGPPEAAAELPTLLELAQERLKAAPAATRRKLAQKKSVSWQRLATLQQILRDLTQSLGMEFIGLKKIPHDLFDAGTLPTATIADQLTFLLAPFDCTWRIDASGKKIEIVPIVRPVLIARTYHWRGAKDARLEAVLAQVPTADVRVAGGRVTVNGTAEEHEKLRELLASLPQSPRTARRTKRSGPERKLFSLRLQDQPAGAVLRELARQLHLQVQVNDGAKASLETRISIDVTQVDLDALLEEIGKAAGLAVTATDAELQVSPR